jgi:hypothetical protein
MTLYLSRDQILGYRLEAHHLAGRAGPGDILAVAGSCGVQDSPPGSAALALNARIEGLTPQDLERSLSIGRSLLAMWCMRGAPYWIPAADAGIITTGLLPDSDQACAFLIKGAAGHLLKFSLSASEAVAMTASALAAVLAGRQPTKDELGRALATALETRIPDHLRSLWRTPDGLGQNTYGESLVRYALYVVSLQGTFCLVPNSYRRAVQFALTREWLGNALPAVDPLQARAEMVRRYLHCYGPGTPGRFARWSGVSPVFARASFALVGDELVEVTNEGKNGVILAEDLPKIQAAAQPLGVRLLPPGDPYLALQDKDILVPDTRLQKEVWKTSGSPGVVLVDGEVVAVWRPHKQGKRLALQVDPLSAGITSPVRKMIEDEAQRMAPFRDVSAVRVQL